SCYFSCNGNTNVTVCLSLPVSRFPSVEKKRVSLCRSSPPNPYHLSKTRLPQFFSMVASTVLMSQPTGDKAASSTTKVASQYAVVSPAGRRYSFRCIFLPPVSSGRTCNGWERNTLPSDPPPDARIIRRPSHLIHGR